MYIIDSTIDKIDYNTIDILDYTIDIIECIIDYTIDIIDYTIDVQLGFAKPTEPEVGIARSQLRNSHLSYTTN